jgi:HD-like signal output (HDOD) protein
VFATERSGAELSWSTGPAPLTRPVFYTALTEGLPSLQERVFALSHLVAYPEADARAAAGIFHGDPALAAHLLRAANATQAGRNRPVWSMDEAITLVGHSGLRTIALTCPLLREAPGTPGDNRVRALWQHSLLAARLAEAAAGATSFAYPELAYVAGLLHDLGKLPLLLLEWEGGCVPGQREDGDEDSLDGELRRYGLNHCEAGRALAVAWNFPGALVETLEFHHAPPGAPNFQQLVALVAGAEEFCRYAPDACRYAGHDGLIHAAGCLARLREILGLPLEECTRVAGVMEEEWYAATQAEHAKDRDSPARSRGGEAGARAVEFPVCPSP